MKRILLIVATAVTMLLSLTSCSDFTSPDRFEGNAYSISGLLVAGNSISLDQPIYVCRSSSINDFNALELFVPDATVLIIDQNTNEQFNLTPALHEYKVKYVDENNHVIIADHVYRIEVDIPGYDKTVWAETHVPVSADLIRDYNNLDVAGEGYSVSANPIDSLSYNDLDVRYPIAMNTGNYSGPVNLYLEFFCLEEFSTALEFTNPIFGTTNPSSNMESDYYEAGESIRRIHFIGRYTSMQQPDYQDNYLLVNDFKQAFIFFGRYRVTAYAVDDNYYKYSYMPEGYLYGGVHNGLGYFGSASGGKMFTKVYK